MQYRILLLLLISCGGCSKEKRPGELPVYPVTGKVTFKGKPMAYAVVTFYPLNQPFAQALKSRATADENGIYQLTTYELNDGAPEGEYGVTIYVPPMKPDPYELEVPKPPDRLKHAYIDPAKSNLQYQVQPQSNIIDIQLP